MANSLHRSASRCSRFLSYCSTNFLIPPRRPESKLFLKRELFCSNFKSLVPSQISHYRCILTVTSLRSGSCENGFSKTLSIEEETAKGIQMGERKVYTSLPVDSWTPESFELYKKLTSDLIEHGNGDWIKCRTSLHNGEKRLFTKAVISEFPGKFFEYQFFFNKKEQRLKGLIQFGPYTQGPPGCVHGGASASMMDAAIGSCVNRCYSHCVTAALNMNYKSFLPLGTTALVESRVDKVEGKKIFGSAELKSPDSKVTYVTSNALFILLDPQDNKDIADKMKKWYRKPT